MLKLDTEWYNLSEKKECTSKYWHSGTAQIVCPWDKYPNINILSEDTNHITEHWYGLTEHVMLTDI